MKPWLNQSWVIPPEESAEFICAMEDILDIYQSEYDEKNPWVCFDESCKQLVKETKKKIPAKPGQPERYDYQYERNGVANMFMFFEPLRPLETCESDRKKNSDRLCISDEVSGR